MPKDYRAAYGNHIFGDEILVSQNVKKHNHALNTLAFGTTGSGKSYGHVKPNLLQLNAAFVCTDPSGDISKELGEAMRRFGYRVKIFDINDMKDCDTYNPLLYCKKEADVKIIVDSFIQSTETSGKSGGQDPFWDNAMNAFLCSIISLLCMIPEGSDVPYAQIPEIMGGLLYYPCFSNLTELTRIANRKWTPTCGVELMPGASLGDGKNNTANASIVSAIYENIRIWEANRQGCTPEEIEQPYTLREWANFTLAPEKTSTTILMTTAVKLDSFKIQQIKDLTSSDTIDLYDFGNQRDVLFLIIPNDVRTYDFLASFLYTQLFSILYHRGSYELVGSSNIYVGDELLRHFSPEQVKNKEDVAFLEKAKAAKPVLVKGNGIVVKKIKTKNGKKKTVRFDDRYYELVASDGTVITRRPTKALIDEYVHKLKQTSIDTKAKPPALPQPVKFICDEFANTGKIPAFLEKLATVRKYHIMVTVICQNLSQLKKMYPDDWSTIDGNCPFFLFLGGDDNETTEYVSKKIGMETIRGSNSSVDGKKINSSFNIDSRELMRPEDIGRIDFNEELLFIYGEQPIYAHKFDLVNHKNYKYTYDYANSLGISDCCVLDRSGMGSNAKADTILKVEKAKAIPNISEFSMKDFRAHMRKFSNDEAMEELSNVYAENMFDDDFDGEDSSFVA